MKKFLFLFMFLFLVVLNGCSNKAQNQASLNAEAFIKNLFRPLTASEYEAFQDWTADNKKIPPWFKERFQEKMSDEAYRQVLETGFYQLPVLVYKSKKELVLKELSLNTKETYTEFNGVLSIDNASEISLLGRMQFTSEGIVTYFEVDNISDLAEAIQK